VLLHAGSKVGNLRVGCRSTPDDVVDRTRAFDARSDVSTEGGDHLPLIRHRAESAWGVTRQNIGSLGRTGHPKVDEGREKALLVTKGGVHGVDRDARPRGHRIDRGRDIPTLGKKFGCRLEYPQPSLGRLLGAEPGPIRTAALDRCHSSSLASIYSS